MPVRQEVPQLGENPANGPHECEDDTPGKPDQRAATSGHQQRQSTDEGQRYGEDAQPSPSWSNRRAEQNLALDLPLTDESQDGARQDEEDEQQCTGVTCRSPEA